MCLYAKPSYVQVWGSPGRNLSQIHSILRKKSYNILLLISNFVNISHVEKWVAVAAPKIFIGVSSSQAIWATRSDEQKRHKMH